MTKRKKPTNAVGISDEDFRDGPVLCQSSSTPSATIDKPSATTSKAEPSEPTTSALIICRNKHWKYISSYHGPWLQLPPEVLESLAYSNYASPRPRPIDPAVFFDLIKIRRLVEDATDLAVRASNGTTSSSLSNSLNAGNGMLGGGGAAALGLGLGGGGAHTKLSRERKHRMREHATQKLSHAYYLDEIAASVATMQSASSLEEVAKLVLQRSANDSDAKYVHFFHEKIPSRMLAQCTMLKPLDEVIQDRPTEGAPLRTRAITRIFKDDFVGAARDLTEALTLCRHSAQHRSGQGQIVLANTLGAAERRNGNARDWNGKLEEEEDHPNSLEPQLLFHRAGVYLTLACQHVHDALDGLEEVVDAPENLSLSDALADPVESSVINEAYGRRLEARKTVKANAKRALRDYSSFLSNFEYTPGLPADVSEGFLQKVGAAAKSSTKPKGHYTNRLLDMSGNSSLSNGTLSDGLISYKHNDSHHRSSSTSTNTNTYSSLPPPEVHLVSSLFSSSPPANLPPYPSVSQALIPRKQTSQQISKDGLANQLLAHSEQHEAVTYHPLLTDALHSLLLCHALIQTSPKEHLRHANMVARLARVCDGYPIFLAARSPSRADWIEVVRRACNWIGLQQSWETLCAPAPLPGHVSVPTKAESEDEAKERHRHEAIMEALADERVHDEASFQAAVSAREWRAEEQRKEELGQTGQTPKRWAQEDGKEYPISTERAEAVARWVREAPLTLEGAGKAKRGARKGKGRNGAFSAASSVPDLNTRLRHLDVNGKESNEAVGETALDE
jgi:hypothetical protein